MLSLVAWLALAQETVVVLTLDREAVAEGEQASFTINTTDSWQPGRWRILGFFSGKHQAIKFDAEPTDPEQTPVIERRHVGQTFTLCVGVFEYGNTQWQAETDAVEGQLNLLLQDRKILADQLSQYASQINAADDAALDALQAAQDEVKLIMAGGEPGAEQAVEDALAAGWVAAEAAWQGVQVALAEWEGLLEDIAAIEAQMCLLIETTHSYYANVVQDDAKAVEVQFLEKETATCKTVHKVRRQLLMVRPKGAHPRIAVDATPAGRVAVTKKDVQERANNKADMITLELEGLAAISGGLRDIEIRALVNTEKIASMLHTNVEYRNLRLTRQHDVNDSPDSFAYDDAKMVVPDNHLLVYLKGSIFPPVPRDVAVKDLIDHLRVELPAVDDSQAPSPVFVRPLPRRPFKKTQKKWATIEFAETKATPAATADKLRLAEYNGGGGTGGGGDFLTVFAYNGLPRLQKNNLGKQTVKIEAISIDGATAALASFDAEYFFTFRSTNHPDSAPVQSHGSVNGLWYYSLEGAGDAPTSAVPGWSWANFIVNGVAYPVGHAFAKDGEPGTLGETTPNPNRSIRLYGESIANASSKAAGYGYAFTASGRIMTLDGDKPVEKNRTFSLTVSEKRFAHVVAHVWRHEKRHAEQLEHLAKANAGDTTDQDGDLVYNLQEVANVTDISKTATWKKFPISTSSANLDQEVDSEILAAPVKGVVENDWAMDTRTEGTGKKKTTIRLGNQWTEE
jgi:hypothetical protein